MEPVQSILEIFIRIEGWPITRCAHGKRRRARSWRSTCWCRCPWTVAEPATSWPRRSRLGCAKTIPNSVFDTHVEPIEDPVSLQDADLLYE